ncbi:hypothetical protein BDB00DRAFT_878375 [Zychaea mexicana]|uniref:uncharacterized protein n=1 Tax=Zychaea mexicana TaxID=64656 RepID=UPI0022FE0D1A|nr:uncharacterized protein BDB00DRAFT_878375 [Zychaea mexicana]KAI9484819.1 hypothetical protein BDB00DRAFT_878375 [Zychaea mexicana]
MLSNESIRSFFVAFAVIAALMTTSTTAMPIGNSDNQSLVAEVLNDQSSSASSTDDVTKATSGVTGGINSALDIVKGPASGDAQNSAGGSDTTGTAGGNTQTGSRAKKDMRVGRPPSSELKTCLAGTTCLE